MKGELKEMKDDLSKRLLDQINREILPELHKLSNEEIDFSEKVPPEKQFRMVQAISKVFLYTLWPASVYIAYELSQDNNYMDLFWLKGGMTILASATLNTLYDLRNKKFTLVGLFEKVGSNISVSYMTGVNSVLWMQNLTNDFWGRMIGQITCSIVYRTGFTAGKQLASEAKVKLEKLAKECGENFFWAALAMAFINMIGKELADEFKIKEIFTVGANFGASVVSTWSLYRALEKHPFTPITDVCKAYEDIFRDGSIKNFLYDPNKFLVNRYGLAAFNNPPLYHDRQGNTFGSLGSYKPARPKSGII